MTDVAFSPGGQQLATATVDGPVWLWDLAAGEPIAILEGHSKPVRAVAFSPNGTQLGSASDDTTVRIWNTTDGKPTSTLEGHTGPVTAMAFAPDATQLASASSDGTVRLWSTATGQYAAALEHNNSSREGRGVLARQPSARQHGHRPQAPSLGPPSWGRAHSAFTGLTRIGTRVVRKPNCARNRCRRCRTARDRR